MISLDQIQKLESRVSRAVELIASLRKENASLSEGLDTYRKRIEEMEILIGKFKEDQNAIERGVMSALEQLDRLEDGLTPEEPSTANAHEPQLPSMTADLHADTEPDSEAVEFEATVNEDPAAPDEEPDSELDIF